MKFEFIKSDSRGKANFGWLKSYHTFSFGSYYNPDRLGFGLLKVLNDDQVEPSKGFETHPHRDMEIVSIPLSGSLRHKDSVGNEILIAPGDVQIMSAGTGVQHSEFNGSDTETVHFLQIWVMPEKRGIHPRYEQKFFSHLERKNKFQTIVSPLNTSDEGVKINQQCYFSLVDLEPNKIITYNYNLSNNGIFVFNLSGSAKIENQTLMDRDAIAIENADQIDIKALEQTSLLIIEVPMS